jgi:hypothetical protein
MKPLKLPTNAEVLKAVKVLLRAVQHRLDFQKLYEYERVFNDLGKDDSKYTLKEFFQFLILIFLFVFNSVYGFSEPL